MLIWFQVYKDVASSQPLARVNVRGARSLSVLELAAPGRTGQTLLAFIEDERHLRVVQYKGWVILLFPLV